MFGEHILLLIPHPDDEVVGCCAAIGRAHARGNRVFGLYLTTGVPSRETLWRWQRGSHARRVARRWAEAEVAAGLLGIEIVGRQPIASRQLKEHLPETRRHIEAAIAETRADMLWAPAYEGGHQDHDAANFLASRFLGRLPVWEFSEYNFAGGRAHSQAFCAPTGTETSLALDAEERARKRRALGLYRSERGNLRHIAVANECFRPLAAYDYGRPPHAGRLFYQRFQWVPRHPRIDYCSPGDVSLAIRLSEAAPGSGL
jgi:LmbE family N-acetylglucosaminyl deacetylase